MALRDDYARAGVPMLPVVLGNGPAARVIFAHTLVLVAVSMTPMVLGFGWLYGAFALTGGAVFIYTSWKLTLNPEATTAMRNFHASLLQLVLVLIGCMIEGFSFVKAILLADDFIHGHVGLWLWCQLSTCGCGKHHQGAG